MIDSSNLPVEEIEKPAVTRKNVFSDSRKGELLIDINADDTSRSACAYILFDAVVLHCYNAWRRLTSLHTCPVIKEFVIPIRIPFCETRPGLKLQKSQWYMKRRLMF